MEVQLRPIFFTLRIVGHRMDYGHFCFLVVMMRPPWLGVLHRGLEGCLFSLSASPGYQNESKMRFLSDGMFR